MPAGPQDIDISGVSPFVHCTAIADRLHLSGGRALLPPGSYRLTKMGMQAGGTDETAVGENHWFGIGKTVVRFVLNGL